MQWHLDRLLGDSPLLLRPNQAPPQSGSASQGSGVARSGAGFEFLRIPGRGPFGAVGGRRRGCMSRAGSVKLGRRRACASRWQQRFLLCIRRMMILGFVVVVVVFVLVIVFVSLRTLVIIAVTIGLVAMGLVAITAVLACDTSLLLTVLS